MKKHLSNLFLLCLGLILFASCSSTKKNTKTTTASTKPLSKTGTVNSKAKVFTKPLDIDRDELVSYAKTFKGTPYKYGSTIPKNGLDCSGFILVVFQNFNVKTPRVTKDYTNEGETISLKNVRPGDILLFTGSDHSTGIIGHMGIVVSNNGTIQFIHSASGKNIGVIESKLTGYWQTHFVKAIRLLK